MIGDYSLLVFTTGSGDIYHHLFGPDNEDLLEEAMTDTEGWLQAMYPIEDSGTFLWIGLNLEEN